MTRHPLRPMQPRDIRGIAVVEELDLSADGRFAVVARRTIVAGRYVTRLHAIPLDGAVVAPPRQLTDGPVRDGQPRIRPDGHVLAFVRSNPADSDAPARIGVLPLAGGRVRLLASGGLHGSVGEIAWSPDGQRLAYTAAVDPPRFLVGRVPPVGRAATRKASPEPDSAAAAPLARRIDRIDWRYDGEGHRDRWSHLFVIEARAGARPRQVTAGDWGVEEIAWHPDGRTIAFSADRGPEPDLRPRKTIWAVDVDGAAGETAAGGTGAEPREVLATGGSAGSAAWSPDGRWIAAVGVVEADPLDDISPTIMVGPADGSRQPRTLAPELDRPIGNWADTDLNGWMVSARSGPFWLDDSTVVATITDRSRSFPVRFRLDPRTGAPAGPPSRPAPREAEPWSDSTTHAIAVSASGVVAALGTLGGRAMELMTLEDDGRGRPSWTTRSRFGSNWQRRHPQPEIRWLDAPGEGGPIETWLASPAGAGDDPLPTIVDIHGGPLGGWAAAPSTEVVLLVARGYRVILPNIRGSASFGRDWIRPQLGDWGGVDAADVHAAVDHVVSLGLADPARLGVLGLSYGGFMVHWLIGTSDRFRAAVSENGVANQVAAWANSDTGPDYDRTSLLGDTHTAAGVAKLWRQSPLAHVADITTPLLMLQAEADARCPAADNEQLFIALRWLRRTVEYVLYPDESHVYSVAGRPDRRIDRMTRMLDWFERYLKA